MKSALIPRYQLMSTLCRTVSVRTRSVSRLFFAPRVLVSARIWLNQRRADANWLYPIGDDDSALIRQDERAFPELL